MAKEEGKYHRKKINLTETMAPWMLASEVQSKTPRSLGLQVRSVTIY